MKGRHAMSLTTAERPTRREFLCTAGLAAAALALPGASAWAQAAVSPPAGTGAGRPNLVLILADDLGYGDVSAYGHEEVRTPNIDGLLASGVQFNRFYANAPVCSPTRAALLTGRYPDCVGVQGVTEDLMYLSPSAKLLPQVLKEAGYATALMGKWHLGAESPNLPNDRGFDTFFGTRGGMLASYTEHAAQSGRPEGLWENQQPVQVKGHATEVTTDRALGWVGEQAKASRPFFLYLAYNAPHTPVQPPADVLEQVRARQPGLGPERVAILALVEHLDREIGRFLEGLRQAGAASNTLIVFVSDNGPTGYGSAKPLRGYKRQLFEGGIRVPCGVSWSGKIAPGRKTETVGMTMDLMPTLCEAAGVEAPKEVDGISLLPTLLDQPQTGTDRYLFWMRRGSEARTDVQAYYAVRRGRFKLMQNRASEAMQLYDLEADPRERSPLAEDHPARQPLLGALRAHVRRTGAVPWQPPGTAFLPPRWPLED